MEVPARPASPVGGLPTDEPGRLTTSRSEAATVPANEAGQPPAQVQSGGQIERVVVPGDQRSVVREYFARRGAKGDAVTSSATAVDELQRTALALEQEIGKVIVGQQPLVRGVVIALLAGRARSTRRDCRAWGRPSWCEHWPGHCDFATAGFSSLPT